MSVEGSVITKDLSPTHGEAGDFFRGINNRLCSVVGSINWWVHGGVEFGRSVLASPCCLYWYAEALTLRHLPMCVCVCVCVCRGGP